MTNHRNERGAALVELAVSIPLLVVMLLLMVQVIGVMMAQLAVQEAARAGARIAAVEPNSGSAAVAAKSATGLNPEKLHVTTLGAQQGGSIKVRVSYPIAIQMPVSGITLVTHTVASEVAMPLEGPR